jgi:GWxTD domain-containing protein
MHHAPRAISWLALSLALLALTAPLAAAKLDAESEEFQRMARHFMTRDEEKVFRNLATPELRREFIDAFWEIRDPSPETAENEFRTEVEERFDFVNKYLREANRPGWDTARGMVYMVLGPPSIMTPGSTPYPSIDSRSQLNDESMSTGMIVWPYHQLNFYVVFIDRQGYGIYELDMRRTAPYLLELLKAAKTRFIRADTGSEDRVLKFTARIDPAQGRLFIAIPAKDLRYEIDADGGFTARIHLAANLYLPDGSIQTHKDDRRIALDPETQGKGRLAIEWTIPLKKGKTQVDLLVLDQVGGHSNRLLLTVKKK